MITINPTHEQLIASVMEARKMSKVKYRALSEKQEAYLKAEGFTRVCSAMTGDVRDCGTYYMNHNDGREVRTVGTLIVQEQEN